MSSPLAAYKERLAAGELVADADQAAAAARLEALAARKAAGSRPSEPTRGLVESGFRTGLATESSVWHAAPRRL